MSTILNRTVQVGSNIIRSCTKNILGINRCTIESCQGFKVKSFLKLRCNYCYYIRVNGRMHVECKASPRHKAREPFNTKLLWMKRNSSKVSPESKRIEFKYEIKGDHFLLPLRNVNPQITCPICNGYFVDATTVIECVHTFCRSCLLKHFEDGDNTCPACHIEIHQCYPSQYVTFDRTMQDIVYKLVPGMWEEEQKRRKEFERKKAIENGEEIAEELNDENVETEKKPCCEENDDPSTKHKRNQDMVTVCLEPGEGLKALPRNILRISEFVTVSTLKRYVALVFYNDAKRYSEFDFFCNNELMGRDFTLKFIILTRWRNRQKEMLQLTFKPHVDY
uniref:39S ribosomal protein L36, mitochondrial n=1 Tax=Parastrongyloides trichosuri TaxID=131310 RepID=A0A0N4ZU00_PARTI